MTTPPPSPDQPRLVLGIDLGTTNSLAAVHGKSGPKLIRDADGEALIPSVVTLLEDGNTMVGKQARHMMLTQPERSVYSVKRLIGRAGPEVETLAEHLAYPVVLGDRGLARIQVDGKNYSPEQISAMILGYVKQTAEAALDLPVQDVVITVPAYFDDAQRQATRDAAELAGLNCLRIINEPTAASLAYGIDGSKDGTVLVYDLGGGTFDVSVLRIQEGVFQVLATAGNTQLGGDDFDALVLDKIKELIKDKGLLEQGINPKAMPELRRSAEALKMQLSELESASLTLDLGTAGKAELTVTRQEFEARIARLVQETLDCCRRALKDAKLKPDDINEVVLVGGSTRIPYVRQQLEAYMGRSPHTEVDPDLAVAMGAAIQADILAGKNRSLLLLDVVSLSLGLETMGGVVSKLILRNATIPSSVTEEFSTQVDNQTGVDINIYQGEREKIEDCRHLGSFKLSGIPAMPAGLPRIAVTFMVNADGVLQVLAKEQRTGAEATIQVVPSFGLSRDEVKQMMLDSIEHAQEDMLARDEVDLRNKAMAMVKGTNKALEMSDLPPDQTYSIRKSVKKLAKLLEEKADLAAVKESTETLSKLTAQVADDVISSAVAKALKS